MVQKTLRLQHGQWVFVVQEAHQTLLMSLEFMTASLTRSKHWPQSDCQLRLHTAGGSYCSSTDL